MYVIYGRPNCHYCDKAKALLDEKGHTYEYHDIMADIAQRAVLLEKMPNLTTVPQIFDGHIHVGGFTELAASL